MANFRRMSFESKNLTSEGIVATTGAPVISTEKYYKGIASMRCNAAGSEVSAQLTPDPGSAGDYIYRVYYYFVSLPGSTTKVLQLQDSGGDHSSIRVTSTGVIQMFDDPATQIGSDGPTLALNTWYRVELAMGTTHTGNDVIARVDGTDFATAATHAAGADHRFVEVGVMGSVTSDMYVDSVAINDPTGTTNTLFPGEDFTLAKTLINKTRPHPFSPGLAR